MSTTTNNATALKIVIAGLEEKPFIWDSKKYPLISFLGFVLNSAFLASSKELAEPLKADVNGHSYQFLDKQINLTKESLPKKERVAYIEKDLLKRNFIGFVLSHMFTGNKDFQTLQIVKDKNTNAAAQKAANLSQLVEVLLTDYRERKLTETNNKLTAAALCLAEGVGVNIPTLQKANKDLTAAKKQLIAPKTTSAVTEKNEQTRTARAAK